MNLTKRDVERIKECHPDIQKVFLKYARITKQPFVVIDGARTIEEQKRNVARGASKTMRSRHIPGANGFSHAIDIAPLVNGKISWDWDYYYPMAEDIKSVAKELGIPLEWGGDWRSFKDGPHWQLPWATYPPDKPVEQSDTVPGFDKARFFDSIRSSVNLTTENVEGFDKLLDFGYERGTPRNWLAYIIATSFWETAQRMQPVREAYWKSEDWRKRNLRYYPYYGRGLPQTTWKENYKKLGDLIGIDLVSNPDLLLDWKYAVPATFVAMEIGLYTGKKLSDYIDEQDESDSEDYKEYKQARRIINGTDKADKIAELSIIFEKGLISSGYPLNPESLPPESVPEEKGPDLPEKPKPPVETPTEEKEDPPKKQGSFTIAELVGLLIKRLIG